ncbi:SDR family NAD(P)-dependent oxidoreductase [Pontibacter arcticus]|uniref:Short-chain dehydrogenase n=1 Tax=Pontibacter arcticus TaxID=2080288 RepID=A0A364RI24_9BACT|nr:SDR family oxidoreductase [Pontibacter arcticus]RAU84000.1 short-chain dehydrogenase [Pontibacter arcticus]
MANQTHHYTALITGASGGIGYELAELFARDGHNLILVARSGDKLEKMAMQFAIKYKVYTKVLVQDLAAPDAAAQVFAALQQESITVDVLVNNAGFGNYGYFRETGWPKEHAMLELNIVALTQLSKLFLAQLPKGRAGKILNIASVASFLPGPMMAVYYASKAYVLSFSEALAAELADENITVTVLCPGATNTDFKDRANLDGSAPFNEKGMTDARSVAEAGYTSMMAGKVVAFSDVKSNLLPYIVNLTPRPLLRRLVKLVQQKRG